MPKPSELATWATDANYSSGPYTGTPTKAALGVGEAERGHYPGAKTAAQKQNKWQNVVSQWVSWLNGLWDGSGNLTLDANASVKVSGTGKYKHGTITLSFPAVAGVPGSGGNTYATPNVPGFIEDTDSAFQSWYVPIVVPVGKRIVTVRGYIKDNATGPSTIRMQIIQDNFDGTWGVIHDVTSAGSGARQVLAPGAPLNYTTLAGKFYLAWFAAQSGSAQCGVHGLEVDIDDL